MKKEKKEPMKIIAEDFVDGTKFGYDEDVNVEMSGQLFFALMRVIGTLANEEVKYMFQIDPMSLAETAKQDNIVNVISNEGITYFNLLGEMESLHMKNIKVGKTLPLEEVQEKIQAKMNKIISEANKEVEDEPKIAPKKKKND